MTLRRCDREHDVQQAAATGRWTTELRGHAAACRSCREIALVTSALLGDTTTAPRRISPAILWAKARHARRRRGETIASRILIGSQVAIGVIGLGVAVYFGVQPETWSAVGADRVSPTLVGSAALVTLASLATFRWLTRSRAD